MLYEPFDTIISSSIPLHNFNGKNDIGMTGNWFVQNSSVLIPGYNVVISDLLSYQKLNKLGAYCSFGANFLGVDRSIDVSAGGSFSAYLSGGKVGLAGTTIYISALFRKSQSNDDPISLIFKDGSCTWCGGTEFEMGYFGSNSNTGSDKFWSFRIANTYYKSDVKVAINETALLILKITFGATNNLALFVNPVSLAGPEPGIANASATTTNSLLFNYMGGYAGNNGVNYIDEIRIGSSFATVSPASNSVSVDKSIIIFTSLSNLTDVLNITSNTGYTITSKNTGWLSLSDVKGLNDKVVNVGTMLANTSGILRTDTIFVMDTATSNKAPVKSIVVRQYPELNSTITFSIKNSGAAPIQNALVEINGIGKFSDASGIVSFQFKQGEKFTYTITSPGYAVSSASIQGYDVDISQNVTLSAAAGYSVSFIVKGEDNVLIAGAEVVFDGVKKYTASNGYVIFTGMPSVNNKLYSANGDGYANISNILSLAAEKDTTFEITLPLIKYFVSINVTDSLSGAPIEAALIKVGSSEYLTNSMGVVEFLSVPVSNQLYTISKNGYYLNQGKYTVSTSDVINNIKLRLITYKVTFNVKDLDNKPVVLASVKLGNETYMTNVNGQVNFNNIAPGTYNYSITKDSYIDINENISVASSDLVKDIIFMTLYYKVNFIVVDTSAVQNPISGATIEFNNTSKVTDLDGKVTFDFVTIGNSKVYNIFKDGYKTNGGSVNVIDQDVLKTVIITPGLYTMKFIVVNPEKKPIPAANVTFNGKSRTTNLSGAVLFDSLQYELGIDYMIVKKGYSPDSGKIDIINRDVLDTVILSSNGPTYKVLFTIKDGNGVPIIDADVNMAYISKKTDVEGKVLFENIVPDDNIEYNIGKQAYVTISNTINIVDKDTSVIEILYLSDTTFVVHFEVKDDRNNPVPNATIVFNAGSVNTDSTGKYRFAEVAPGSGLNYVVFKTGYSEASGKINVINDSVSKSINLVLFRYQASFIVKDELGEIIAGAKVKFYGDSALTDSTGKVVFKDILPSIDNEYKISKDLYHDVSGKISVTFSDIDRLISMQRIKYQLSIIVEDSAGVIDNAIVRLGNISFSTDSKGLALFEGLVPSDTLIYTISKAGYLSFSDTIFNFNSDTIDTARIKLDRNFITFIVKSKFGNLLKDVALTFDGKLQYTDSTGRANFISTTKTAVRYTAVKTRFVSVSKLLDINKDTLIVITMDTIITNYQVTFTVIDENGKAMKGAIIEFYSDTFVTGDDGKLVFVLPSLNSEPLRISKPMYNIINTFITINGNTKKTFNLVRSKYNLSFRVIDQNDEAINGARISFYNVGFLTDTAGALNLKGITSDTAYYYRIEFGDSFADSGYFDLLKDTIISVRFVGVGLKENFSIVSIYPNPASDNIYINQNGVYTSYGIYTYSGILIKQDRIINDVEMIDVSKLNNGMYILMLIRSNGYKDFKRFLKQ